MLFTSIDFLVFLPVVFLLYWFVLRSRKQQNALIVVASYVFYGWWDWRFLSLLFLTSVSSYAAGRILRSQALQKWRKTVVGGTIGLNILILALFKYYDFFVGSLLSLFGSFGLHADWPLLNVILPMGISFYTFQALSYVIDVYRGDIEPTGDVVEFLAYISFFPQLVAGPIERATRLLPQFARNRTFDYSTAIDGTRQMLWGFFKKIVVADRCAWIVNDYWGKYESLSSVSLIVLGVLFSFQIYCDFSGYSDIAIGCAKLFGIRLMRNFDTPYFSRDIAEFWRRWHISLMSWFRDYVYIPLGGNRCSKAKQTRNVMTVWLLSGLWHGANWTFVCWGLYHGVLLMLHRLLGFTSKKSQAASAVRRWPSAGELARMLLTFALVVVGWIVFRSTSINEAFGFLLTLATHPLSGNALPVKAFCILGLALAFTAVEWLTREKEHALCFGTAGIFRESRCDGRSTY